MKSVETSLGVLVVIYDDGYVEIASNHRLSDPQLAFRSRQGNVFLPYEEFQKLLDDTAVRKALKEKL